MLDTAHCTHTPCAARTPQRGRGQERPATHGACGCYPPPPPTGNGGGGSPPPQPTKRAGAPCHHLTEGGGGPRPQAQTRTHGATGEPLRKGRVRKYPAAPLRAAPPRRSWRAWKETALPDRRNATYPKGAKRLEGATRRYRRPTRHRGCAGKRQGHPQGHCGPSLGAAGAQTLERETEASPPAGPPCAESRCGSIIGLQSRMVARKRTRLVTGCNGGEKAGGWPRTHRGETTLYATAPTHGGFHPSHHRITPSGKPETLV